MLVKDLIKMDVDIDVYDDYDERLGIAYCYGYALTPEGEEHFSDALALPVELYQDAWDNVAVVHCETGKQATQAMKFFNSLAGYCPSSDFDKWFTWIE